MKEVRCQCLVVAPWSATVVPEQAAARSGVVAPETMVGGF